MFTEESIYIFELKISGRDKDSPPTGAIAQIKEKGYNKPYISGGKRIVMVGMAFDRESKNFTRDSQEQV